MNYVLTFCFMILDFITGIAQAIKTKTFNSSVMRQGLFHKFSLIILMVLGVLIDYAQKYINLGFNKEIGVAVCVYIILMEIASVIENVGRLNPELLPDKLQDIFEKLKKE